jgi:ParB family chromosome partitioning protein
MARKILFEVTEAERRPEPSKAPALSGMARSLQAAAAASIREIDPKFIEDSEFQDRIDTDDEEIVDLAESIKAQGQLIPILVSPLPLGRYRIVYGRRRLAALRRIGAMAKALVREMDEDQAILAQGQENTFRRDLTWIEKAAFARQLLEAGKSDELVCDALNIDQKARKSGDKLTGLSRMRAVAARLAPELIEAIGPAPKVGRDRWYDFAQTLEKKGFPPGNQGDLIATAQGLADLPSDERFLRLEAELKRQAAKPAPAEEASSVRATPRAATITVSARLSPALYRWIKDHPEAALAALQRAQEQPEQ